jgi:uncharacterized secreted protein with C-terminal beta-propeller domain
MTVDTSAYISQCCAVLYTQTPLTPSQEKLTSSPWEEILYDRQQITLRSIQIINCIMCSEKCKILIENIEKSVNSFFNASYFVNQTSRLILNKLVADFKPITCDLPDIVQQKNDRLQRLEDMSYAIGMIEILKMKQKKSASFQDGFLSFPIEIQIEMLPLQDFKFLRLSSTNLPEDQISIC